MPSKWLAVIYNSNLTCNDALRVAAARWLHPPVLVFARASEQPAPKIVRLPATHLRIDRHSRIRSTSLVLGVLEPSVVLQVNRDAGCPPSVTSNGGKKTRRLGSLANCSPGVVPVQSASSHCRSK